MEAITTLKNKRCIPCEGGVPPMPEHKVNEYLTLVDDWDLVRNPINKIRKNVAFNNFTEVMKFVNAIASIAFEEGHHPDLHITYNTVLIELYTHAINGLSENDFILAVKIDSLPLS